MSAPATPLWLERGALQRLLDALASRFDRVLGPVLRDGAVVPDRVRRVEDLPVGWRDRQADPARSAAQRAAGLEPLLHRQLPRNDGGLAAGQAAVAAARLQAGALPERRGGGLASAGSPASEASGQG